MWDFSRLERVAITLLEEGRLQGVPLVGARFPFERAAEAYARIDAEPGGAVKILLTYEQR
jgi:threonine dehydrogenase-like Zn-dependent dehydrogenase